jgi:hypothetical protein
VWHEVPIRISLVVASAATIVIAAASAAGLDAVQAIAGLDRLHQPLRYWHDGGADQRGAWLDRVISSAASAGPGTRRTAA